MDGWSGEEVDDHHGDVEADEPGGAVIREGPAGMDDPDTEWTGPELEVAPIELSPDEFVVLEPGEDPEIWAELPKERNLRFGLAARTGQLVVCDGRRRTWLRMGNGAAPDHGDAPIAAHMIVAFIARRNRGRRTRPKEYLVLTDSLGQLLGWLDYSDRWSFNTGALRQIAAAGGLHYEVQRFNSEPDFELAHPDWVG
jgi:hypothetical protein